MKYVFFLICFSTIFSCQAPEQEPVTLFTLISAESGIDFSNTLTPTDSINPYTFRNFYNGAGVGLADFNNDGLTDIFFAGNQVDNALYINHGNLKFKDIAVEAGVASSGVWSTGVSIADVNGDGWSDIYVCKSGEKKGDNRHNELFINTGKVSEDGMVTFEEKAKAYGLADLGLSTHAAFFDYDKDGDLDCYLLNNSYRSVGAYDLIPDQRNKRDADGGNKLYRNDLISNNSNGVSKFTDVSDISGIYGSAIGFGLGVAIGDVNGDDWPDIYVSNDFFEKDYLYINNQDGTFKEDLEKHLNEISLGSMGADIADINNDGLPEIFVTEMLPKDPKRYKVKSQFEDWNKYSSNVENGYFRQFGRNMLQLNQGKGQYVDISRITNMDATDWSWGALIADFNADGNKDVFVANGIPRDLLDQDYINFFSDARNVREIIQNPDKGMLGLIDKMPSEPLSNFMFENDGSLSFTNITRDWGLGQESFSNGSAYGDLDNDGDLDLIINNLDSKAFVYRNNTSELNPDQRILKIVLNGKSKNTKAVGSKIYVWSQGVCHFQEIYPQRGFMSTVDTKLSVGIGNNATVDSVLVVWPQGGQSFVKDLDPSIELVLNEGQDLANSINTTQSTIEPLLSKEESIGELFNHNEVDYSDYDRESLLFSMSSKFGPSLCEGDVNNDGLMDFYVGGAKDQVGELFVQKPNGDFRSITIEEEDKYEETECLFFDANGDAFVDLYIGSGSSEFGRNNSASMDRMFFNKNGTFTKSSQTLPTFNFEHTSSVEDIDFDLDGDRDLIVGIHSRAFQYGLPSNVYLLENDGSGQFKNVTKAKAHEMYNIGITTDVKAGDFDQDDDEDILVVGEWMAPTIFLNDDGYFKKQKVDSSLYGLWKYAEVSDIDLDGDEDVLLGNIGLNNQWKTERNIPMKTFVNDFDQNGKIEQIRTLQYNGRDIPVHMRGDLIKQIPIAAKVLPDYHTYADKSIDEIFPEVILSKSHVIHVNERRSGILKNDGKGLFSFEPLPFEAQLSSVNTAIIEDFNGDENLDLLLGGNDYTVKPQMGIQAGSNGVMLLSDENKSYSVISHTHSGFLEKGVIRNFVDLSTKIVVGKNNESISIYNK